MKIKSSLPNLEYNLNNVTLIRYFFLEFFSLFFFKWHYKFDVNKVDSSIFKIQMHLIFFNDIWQMAKCILFQTDFIYFHFSCMGASCDLSLSIVKTLDFCFWFYLSYKNRWKSCHLLKSEQISVLFTNKNDQF